MKTFILMLTLALASLPATAASKSSSRPRAVTSKPKAAPKPKTPPRSTGDHHVQVKAHKTKAGVKVPAHERTKPNATQKDNWSTKGNSNPHSGKPGTVTPKK